MYMDNFKSKIVNNRNFNYIPIKKLWWNYPAFFLQINHLQVHINVILLYYLLLRLLPSKCYLSIPTAALDGLKTALCGAVPPPVDSSGSRQLLALYIDSAVCPVRTTTIYVSWCVIQE